MLGGGGYPLGPPGGGGAAARVGRYEFEYWNDRSYELYGPGSQDALNAKFAEAPRPKEVQLEGGKYTVENFDEVEYGSATQVNNRTRFERNVRLRPPYEVPGHSAPSLPPRPWHFVYEDRGWSPYSHRLQGELDLFAQCRPLPKQIFFVEAGKPYWLIGFDTLVTGKPDLTQVNIKSSNVRRVRLEAGASPAPAMGSIAPGGPGRGRGGAGGHHHRGGGRGHMRSGPAPAAGSAGPAASTTLDRAVFNILRPGRGGKQPLPAEAQTLLKNELRADPRPETVTLPNGDIVEQFNELEVAGACLVVGGATGSHGGSTITVGPFVLPSCRAPPRTDRPRYDLELSLPLPEPGAVNLPDELDESIAADFASFGRHLSRAEALELATRGNKSNECSICLCELSEGDNSNDLSNAAAAASSSSSNAYSNATDDSGIFELTCGHAYHTACLEQWFASRPSCPQCLKKFGRMVGKQPSLGSLSWYFENHNLPGHENTNQTIVIQFDFPQGVDEQGAPYDGRKPKGYLPGNTQGILLLELFKIAFRRRVMFGLGESMTFGTQRPTFNIHIKTSTHRGMAGHGYPDPDYFRRSLEELRTNGVTMADLRF